MPGFLRKIVIFLAFVFCVIFAAPGAYANTITLNDWNATTNSSPATISSSTTSITIPTKTGYDYGGHYYFPNCFGTQVINSSGTWTSAAPWFDTTLYACWRPKRITMGGFIYGGITGGVDVGLLVNSSLSTLKLEYGKEWLDANNNMVTKVYQVPSKAGYIFTGCYTGANGTGTQIVDPNGKLNYYDGLTAFTSGNPVLRCLFIPENNDARWVKITLDSMDAETEPTTTVFYKNIAGDCSGLRTTKDCSATTVTSVTKPTLTGNIFGGYYTGVNGSGTQVIGSGGAFVTNAVNNITTDITIYAKWTVRCTKITLSLGTNAAPSTLYLKYGDGWYTNSTCTTSIAKLTTLPQNTNYTGKAGYYFKYASAITSPNTGVDNFHLIAPDGTLLTAPHVLKAYPTSSSATIYAGGYTGYSWKRINLNNGTGNVNYTMYEARLVGFYNSNNTSTMSLLTDSVFAPLGAHDNGGFGWTKPSTPSDQTGVFAGYYTAASCSGTKIIDADGYMLTSPAYWNSTPVTLYACYQLQPIIGGINAKSISLDANGGATCSQTSVSLMFPNSLNCLPTYPGYHFMGYYNNATNGQGKQYFDANGNRVRNRDLGVGFSLYAHWEPVKYKIQYKCSESGSVVHTDYTTYGAQYLIWPIEQFCDIPANSHCLGWDGGIGNGNGWVYSGVDTYDYANDQTVSPICEQLPTMSLNAGATDNTPAPSSVDYFAFVANYFFDSASPYAMLNNMSMTPIRYGYDFGGFYDNANSMTLIEADGDFVTSPQMEQFANLSPVWTERKKTITLNFNSGTQGNAPTNVAYRGAYGWTSTISSTTTLTSLSGLPTRTGYTFGGFYNTAATDDVQVIDANGNFIQNDTIRMYQHIGRIGTTIYAKWTLGNYQINLDNANATTNGTATIYNTYQTGVYLNSAHTQSMTTSSNPITIPQRTGYSFAGYYNAAKTPTQYIGANGLLTSEGYNNALSNTSNGTQWLAQWTPNTITLDWDENGGNAINNGSCDYGDDLILPAAPTRPGYTFAGWKLANNTTQSAGATITGGCTSTYTGVTSGTSTAIQAQWSPKIITVNLDDKYYETTSSVGVVPDVERVVPFVIYQKYNDGWYTDSSATISFDIYTDMTFPEKTGYTLHGFYTGKAGTGLQVIEPSTYSILNPDVCTTNCTLYAHYTPNIYTVTLNDNGGSGGSGTVYEKYNTGWYTDAGATTPLTGNRVGTPTRANYTFRGYTVTQSSDITTSGNYDAPIIKRSGAVPGSSTFSADATVYASWVRDCAATSPATCNRTSSTSGNTETITYETSCPSGYTINNNGSYNPSCSPNTYTIAYADMDGATHGSSHPTTGTYDTEFTVNNPTKPGYTFAGWDISGMDSVTHYYGASSATSTSSATSLGHATITPSIIKFKNLRATSGTVTFTAVWTPNTYTVTFKTGDTILGTQNFNYGTAQNLTELENLSNVPGFLTDANYGWEFYGWSTTLNNTTPDFVDGENVNNLTATNGGDVVLYGVWKRDVSFTYYANASDTNTTTSTRIQYYRNVFVSGVSGVGSTAVETYPLYTNTTYGWAPQGWVFGSTNSTTVNVSQTGTTTNNVGPSSATHAYYAVYNRSVTLTYNGNGNTGGSAPSNTTGTQAYNAGANAAAVLNMTLASNTFTKTNYTFSKWASGSTSGTQYNAGITDYPFPNTAWTSSATNTMYAIWTPNVIASASDKQLTYNGSAQSCANVTVTTPANGYTIKYSNAANGTFTTTVPTMTNVSESPKTVYYQVSASGYVTATGNYNCTMINAEDAVTIMDGTTNVTNSGSSTTYPNNKVLTATCASGATPTLSNTGTASVATATINNGTITMVPVAAGATTSTITVSCAAASNYNTATATYTLTVNKGTITHTPATLPGNSKVYDTQPLSCTGGITGRTPSNATMQYAEKTGNSCSGVSYSSTVPSRTNVGTTTVCYKLSAANYNDKLGEYSCTVTQASGSTKIKDGDTYVTNGSGSVVYPSTKSLTAICAGGATISSVTSGTTSVATVSNSGNNITITPVAAGATTSTITVNCPATTNYAASSATYTITVNKGTCTVSLSAASGSTAYPTTKQITASSNSGGTLSVASSAESVATAAINNGTVTMTPVAQGNATITVTSAATSNYNSCSASYALTVNRGTCTMTLTPTSGTVTYPGTTTTFNIDKGASNGAVSTLLSNNTSSATVALSSNDTVGTVTYGTSGGVTVTVTAAQTNQYDSCSATYTGTAADKIITLKKNGGTGTCGGASGTNDGTLACTLGGTCTAPSWNSSTCNITNGTKIFDGWATSASGAVAYEPGDNLNNAPTPLYAHWSDVTCDITNGTGTATTPSNNAPICTVTCNDGYSTSGTYTGTGTTVTHACTGNDITLDWDENGGGAIANGSCIYGGDLTLPAAPSRTGYTFTKWKLADGTLKNASSTVTNGCIYTYTNKYSGTSTAIQAQWTENTNTPYTVYHYIQGVPGSTYTQYGNTETLYGTTGATVTLATLKKTITGYTYLEGFAAGPTGNVKPSSGAVLETTILANGSRVITLYYNRDTREITLDNANATTNGTSTIYTRYQDGVWLNSARTSPLTTTSGAITKPQRTGYTFNGYYSQTSGGTQYISNIGRITQEGIDVGEAMTASSPAETWHAQWSPNTYSISYANMAAATHGESHPTSATYDVEFTVSNPTRYGYDFGGWNITGMDSTTHYYGATTADTSTTATSLNNIMVTKFKNLRAGGTVTFTAVWNPKTTAITLDKNAADAVAGTTSVTGTYNETLPTITIPTRPGYSFKGYWDTNANSGGYKYYDADGTGHQWNKIDATATLYGRWNLDFYTISYTLNGGTNGTNNPTGWTVTNQSTTLNRPTRANSTFTGWTVTTAPTAWGTGSSTSGALDFVIGQGTYGNIVFEANWTCDTGYSANNDGTACVAQTSTVTLNKNAADATAGTAYVTATYGSAMPTPITLPTRIGYNFAGYWDASSGGTKYYNADGTSARNWDKTGDQTLYAHWGAWPYKISYELNGGTEGTYHPTSVYYNEEFTVSNPTHPHATFHSWVISGMGTAFPHYYGTTSANTEVTGDSVEVNPSAVKFKNLSSNTATFKAVWECDSGYSGNSCTANEITLDWDENGGSAVANGSCTYGGDLVLPAAPTLTGYTFSGWKLGDSSVQNAGTTVTNGCVYGKIGVYSGLSTIISAVWTPQTSTVTLDKNAADATAGTASVTATYDAPMPTPITLPTRTGYNFSGYWDDPSGGTKYYNNNGTSARNWDKTGNQTLYAHWSKKKYTITVTKGAGVSTVAADGWTNTGTATMTKIFYYGDTITLSTITGNNKTGYTGTSYAITSGEGSISNGVFTVGASDATITVSATGITAPTAAHITITGGTTKIYGKEATTLTAGLDNASTIYDNSISLKYTFGYTATSASSTCGSTYSYGDEGTSATTSISATQFRGYRCYKVKVSAVGEGNLTSGESVESSASTTMGLINRTVTFNATQNGGTISGTSPLYVSYNNASVYTTATGTTTGTVPSATKTGYTFSGWYTAATGGSQIYNASGTITSATVSGYTSGSKWVATADKELFAQFTANTNTAYKVCRYTKNLGASAYTLNGGACENKTGTTGATITLSTEATNITGFTYDEGFAGTAATGTTKPASGAVTTTTILADGTRVISLYYNRNSYNVSLTSGTGISAVTGGGTYEYGANVSINATVKNGYTWSKWQQTTGGAQVSTTKNYTFAMPASDLSYTAVATLNTYTITYDLDGGTHGTTHPTTYNVTSADIILSNPTKTGYTFGGWTVTVAPNGWGTGSSNSGSTNFKIATGTYGNIAFKAIWTPNAYVINYDMRGGDNYANAPTSYTYGVGATINGTPSRANSTFTGWTGDNGDTPQTTITISTTATGDKNYIANWSCLDGYHANNDGTACVGNTITLNYANGGHGTAPAAGSCTYGSTFDLPLLTAAGYTFDEWHVNNNAFDNGQTGVACNYANLGVYSGSVTITATWNTDVYTVTLSDGTGAAQNGAPSPIYLKYNDGWYSNQSATTTISALTTTPIKVGYLFDGYYTGENGTGTQIINNAGTIVANNTAFTANATVYAKYTAQTGFTVTTTNLAANTVFKFAISAAGQFYIDWGDGTVESLNRENNTTETLVPHTYTAAGVKDITIYGRATGYNTGNSVAAIRFGGSPTESEVTKDLVGGISGSLTSVFPTVTGVGSPIFKYTFGNCTGLSGNIPTNLFTGLSGAPKESQFAYLFEGDSGLTGQIPSGFFGNVSGTVKKSTFERTFHGCSGLLGGATYAIPENLFDNITGSAQSAFALTFGACSGLVGQIPANLFEHLTGTPQSRMFLGTFRDCVGLTGTVPEDLFGGISGAAENSAFNYTFGNCSGLTGYVPRGLFAGITSNAAGRVGTFSGSGLVAECPCGMKQYITGLEGADGKITTKVSCQFGAKTGEYWHNGHCVTECESGITRLRTSNGVDVPLLRAKVGIKNVAFKHNNKVCYSPVETGNLSGHVNLKQGATTYHISEPDGVEPDGFRNLPDGVLPAPGYTVE